MQAIQTVLKVCDISASMELQSVEGPGEQTINSGISSL